MLASFLSWWAQNWRAHADRWRGGLDAPRLDPPQDRPPADPPPSRLVARAWHGRVPIGRADAYERVLERTGFADYRATPGNRGVLALRHDEGDQTHFQLITLWESRDAIARFAGDDIDRARYYPEDGDFLLEFEPRVTHHDVVVAP